MSARSRKCQASVIDLIVGFTIFLTVFIINYYLWNSVGVKLENNKDFFKASVIMSAESLIRTQGEPSDWEENLSNARGIGLAIRPNILSSAKLLALNSSYDSLSELLLPTGEYEITIRNSSGIVYQTGKTPVGEVTRVDRIVKINNSYYLFTLKGWVNE